MREELFDFLVAFGHDMCYWREYKLSARRIGNVYSSLLLLTSAAGITSWSYWQTYATFWAIVTLAAQILQALKPLTQAERQRQALIYILQDEQVLFDELSDYWFKVGRYDPPRAEEEEIQDKIMDIKKRKQAIFDRFASDIDFPEKKHLQKKAKKENTRYFWYYYRVDIKEVTEYVEQ